MSKTVVITGVSSGIGLATAQVLMERGYRVFGSVRKAADGERVREQLGEAFTPLLFDVTDHIALKAAVAQVQAAVGSRGLCALINNAGMAPSGPLMHTTIDEMRQVFEVNVFGLLTVTQAFLPLLGASKDSRHAPGRIVNISSISGGITFPLVALYAMSKHAVESLTDGLRRELSIYGIQVSALEPGAIKTPIWDKAVTAQDLMGQRFGDTDYAEAIAYMPKMIAREMKSAKPMAVVTDAIVHALEAKKAKPRYPLTALWYLHKLIPLALFDYLTVRITNLRPVRNR